MPYTTLVAGTTITASWGNASVRDQAVTPFATAAARTSAVGGSPPEGMLTYRVDGKVFDGHDGTGWVAAAQYMSLARKASDESITSSTTMQDDNDLLHTVRASAVYEMTAYISYTSNTTADIKFGWTYPAGLTINYLAHVRPVATAVNDTYDLIQTDPLALEGAGVATRRSAFFLGLVVVSSTAGTLQLQWAQNTSDAGATALKAGSFMTLRRMA